MNIIFLSRYQGKIERGVENYVRQLSSRLSTEHRVEVLTSAWELIGKKPDIIYPVNGYWQSLSCRIYSWLIGAKLVLGGHAGIGRDDRWNLYMFPDLFIAFSQKGYDWAKKVNRFVKIIKIPHGVDLRKFNPNVKPTAVDLERPIFITVSHLVPYKRVGETVKAVAKLKQGSLFILGDGPLVKEIDDLGNQLLGKKRYLRLTTSHNKVASYLTASDVFTLVSAESEAFGLAYLEALACNLPVVATDDPLRHELVGEAGKYVADPADARGYAKVLDKTAKQQCDTKPRQQATKFSWDTIADSYKIHLASLSVKR